MVRCIASLMSPAPVLPFDHRMRSSRSITRSVAACGAGGWLSHGRSISVARCAAARPNTTMSSSELEPKPVGTVHGNAGGLADRHQTRHDRFGIAVLLGDDLAVQVGGHAAHVVVNRRQHRDRFARHINAGENLCGLADPAGARAGYWRRDAPDGARCNPVRTTAANLH